MTDIERAKARLCDGGFTCVMCREEQTLVSTERGVKPLLSWLTEGKGDGFFAADKVVGAGAAFLYVLLGVREVYADVMSKPALDILIRYGIKAECGTLCANIINRVGTGICPIEQAVAGIDTPTEALKAIEERLKTL
ncbi:MAG: DUF1893 domain-containing protein [Ruminococcaceae bacterium]|nr:DUF1893 domain-containing protein [Oscillospiraceae bacterium]